MNSQILEKKKIINMKSFRHQRKVHNMKTTILRVTLELKVLGLTQMKLIKRNQLKMVNNKQE